MQERPDTNELLTGVRSIQGVLGAYAFDDSGQCLGYQATSARDEGHLDAITTAVERLRVVTVAMGGPSSDTSGTILIRYERSYMLVRRIDSVFFLVIAAANANLGMINVGLRVIELKLGKRTESGPILSAHPQAGAGSTPGVTGDRAPSADDLLHHPLLCSLQDLFVEYVGPRAQALFKSQVRVAAGKSTGVPTPEQFGAIVDGLGRFIREPTQRAVFTAQAETVRMRALAGEMAAERDELRKLFSAVQDGMRICSRIAAPTRSIEVTDEEQLASEVIEFCASNDSLFTKYGGAEFRENFLRLTEHLVATRRELGEAGRLQRMLVPSTSNIDHSFAQIAAYFSPAAQCGGDWWNTKRLAGDKLLVILGDVTGHSLSTAIITGVAKAACDAADTASVDMTCEEILQRMNDSIYDTTRAKVLMTCVASIIDPHQRTLTVASAGHNFPYLVRQEQGDSVLRTLVARGNPLGSAPRLEVETSTVTLQYGDLVIWYTDGATECANDQSEAFGDRRFRRILRKFGALGAAAVRDAVIKAIDSFRGQAMPSDDVTFIAGKIGESSWTSPVAVPGPGAGSRVPLRS